MLAAARSLLLETAIALHERCAAVPILDRLADSARAAATPGPRPRLAYPSSMSPRGQTLASIALGANLGDRAATIRSAIEALAALPGSRLVAASTIVETEPAGPIPQGPYLNAAAILETSLPPRVLLDHLLEIERRHGRE